MIAGLAAAIAVFGGALKAGEGPSDAEIKAKVGASLVNNVDNAGNLDEYGYVKDLCRSTLDMSAGSETVREAIANGSVTTRELAEDRSPSVRRRKASRVAE